MKNRLSEGLDPILATWPKPMLPKRLREWASSLSTLPRARGNHRVESEREWACVLNDIADALERGKQ